MNRMFHATRAALNNLWWRCRVVGPVLWDGLFAVLKFVAAIAVCFAVGLTVGLAVPTDVTGTRPIRIAGFLLQCAGIWTVFRGISSRQRMFDVPTWRMRLWTAIRAQRGISGEALIGVGATGAIGRVTASVSAGEGASVEDRVRALEQNLTTIRNDVAAVEKELRASDAAIRQALNNDMGRIDTSIREVKDQLQELSISSVYIDRLGLSWLLTGALLTSLPDEIAPLLKHLY